MAETITKLPVKTEEEGTASALRPWRPFDSLRREIDQMFDEFEGGVWRWPFRRSFFDIEPFRRTEAVSAPAVDVTEIDKAYEIAAELPGMSDKNVAVKLAEGELSSARNRRRKSRRRRIITCMSAASARSSAPFRCAAASMPTR